MAPVDLRARKWRAEGRTIVAMMKLEESSDDPMIGVMDTEELAGHVIEGHELLQKGDIAAAAEKFEAMSEVIEHQVGRLQIADRFVDWLLAMDDPLDAEGRSRRQRVNLAWILQEAQTVKDTRGDDVALV